MALSLGNGSLTLYYATWLLVAFVGAGTLPITWTRAVNNGFHSGKGLALGLSLIGTGLFGYLIKPFAAWLIGAFGWRSAYVVIGALPLLVLPRSRRRQRPARPIACPAARGASGGAARCGKIARVAGAGFDHEPDLRSMAILAPRGLLRGAGILRRRIDSEHGKHAEDCRI
jgi:MFS family permease